MITINSQAQLEPLPRRPEGKAAILGSIQNFLAIPAGPRSTEGAAGEVGFCFEVLRVACAGAFFPDPAPALLFIPKAATPVARLEMKFRLFAPIIDPVPASKACSYSPPAWRKAT